MTETIDPVTTTHTVMDEQAQRDQAHRGVERHPRSHQGHVVPAGRRHDVAHESAHAACGRHLPCLPPCAALRPPIMLRWRS